MNVRFYLSYDIKITLKYLFCRKNFIILSLCMQLCYGGHNVVMDVIMFPENLLTTSGLLILLHGIISLPDATLCDKNLHTGQFCMLFCHLLIFFKISFFSKYTFRITIRVSNSLDPDQV